MQYHPLLSRTDVFPPQDSARRPLAQPIGIRRAPSAPLRVKSRLHVEPAWRSTCRTAFGSACMHGMQAESEALLGAPHFRGTPQSRNSQHLPCENVDSTPPCAQNPKGKTRRRANVSKQMGAQGEPWGPLGAPWGLSGVPRGRRKRTWGAPRRLLEPLWETNVVKVGLDGRLDVISARFWELRTLRIIGFTKEIQRF